MKNKHNQSMHIWDRSLKYSESVICPGIIRWNTNLTQKLNKWIVKEINVFVFVILNINFVKLEMKSTIKLKWVKQDPRGQRWERETAVGSGVGDGGRERWDWYASISVRSIGHTLTGLTVTPVHQPIHAINQSANHRPAVHYVMEIQIKNFS